VFSDFHHWAGTGELPPAQRALSGRWHAVQIDDPVHEHPPPTGAYPARSMVPGAADEDLYVTRDRRQATEAITGRLNRELEARGWRIAGGTAIRREGWSDVT